MHGRTIVQVTLWNSPYMGNFLTSQLRLAAAVREELGLSTHLVLGADAGSLPWLSELDAAGVGWSLLPAHRRAFRGHLEAVLHDGSGALVHSHFTLGDLAAASAARALRIPCVWHLHTGFVGYPPYQRAKDLLKMRLIARRDVARAVAVSPWIAALAERRGMPRERILTLPNAIVLERFATLPDRTAARARFALPEDVPVVLGLAWWPEVKGADVMLDALRTLAGPPPRAVGLLVGEDRLREFVERREGGVPPWLRRSPFVSDPAWLYAAADVFVSASRHEGQPYSLGEALACGLPSVMSEIDGTAVYRGAPGLRTFPSEDAGALAETLSALLGEPADARAAMGEANRAWADEHLAIEPWCERMVRLYWELLR